MSRPSKRFTPSRWSEFLVPAILVILLLVLFGTIIFVVLFSLGVIPGA
jgi:uncharacterized integral membrane protein